MLRWKCGVTKMDTIRKECISESLNITNTAKKMRKNRLRLFGHVKGNNNNNKVKKIDEIRVEGN